MNYLEASFKASNFNASTCRQLRKIFKCMFRTQYKYMINLIKKQAIHPHGKPMRFSGLEIDKKAQKIGYKIFVGHV